MDWLIVKSVLEQWCRVGQVRAWDGIVQIFILRWRVVSFGGIKVGVA